MVRDNLFWLLCWFCFSPPPSSTGTTMEAVLSFRRSRFLACLGSTKMGSGRNLVLEWDSVFSNVQYLLSFAVISQIGEVDDSMRRSNWCRKTEKSRPVSLLVIRLGFQPSCCADMWFQMLRCRMVIELLVTLIYDSPLWNQFSIQNLVVMSIWLEYLRLSLYLDSWVCSDSIRAFAMMLTRLGNLLRRS